MKPFDPSWPEILRRQDALLRFDRPISNRDALTLGLYAIEAAEQLGVQLAFRVFTRGAIVFSHHMDGVGLGNDWWMDKKLNTCRETGIANLLLFSEVQSGEREAPACLENESSFAIDGGCVPLKLADGRVFGYMLASGAPHQYDHECVTRAIARFLGRQITSVVN